MYLLLNLAQQQLSAFRGSTRDLKQTAHFLLSLI
jgi:hypothetical protein